MSVLLFFMVYKLKENRLSAGSREMEANSSVGLIMASGINSLDTLKKRHSNKSVWFVAWGHVQIFTHSAVLLIWYWYNWYGI